MLPGTNRDGDIVVGSGAAGNTVAYAMRKGELHLCTRAGTRFAIRFTGGRAFIWGIPEEVELSFNKTHAKPQFLAEYMTGGTIVFCPNPGYNLLCAAIGSTSEILSRKPESLSLIRHMQSLQKRIPDSFEAVPILARHPDLAAEGHKAYVEKVRRNNIAAPVTPIKEDEDFNNTFALIREQKKRL
ncbi:MAG: hypothetical protein GY866_29545 [Proteobacteria bacterium]|nr:hypothetical protein [Pseudomonadota bacterium]